MNKNNNSLVSFLKPPIYRIIEKYYSNCTKTYFYDKYDRLLFIIKQYNV